MREVDRPFPSELYLPEYRASFSFSVANRGIPATQGLLQGPNVLELREFSRKATADFRYLEAECSEWLGGAVNYDAAEELSGGFIRATYTERPDGAVILEGRVQLQGGRTLSVDLPPSGWVIPDRTGDYYSPETGLPLATTSDERQLALSEGTHHSYFWRGDIGDGVCVLNRECERILYGDFDLNASLPFTTTHPDIGLRKVTRR